MYNDLIQAIEKCYKFKPSIINFDKTNNEHMQMLLSEEKIRDILEDYFAIYIITNNNLVVIEKQDYIYDDTISDIIDRLIDLYEIMHVKIFIDEYITYKISDEEYRVIFDTDYLELEYDDSIIEEELNFFNEYLQRIYDEPYKKLYVSASNLTWRGLSGYKIIEKLDNILYELLPEYDATVVFYQNVNNEKDIFVKVYSHDVPTGSTYELIQIPDIPAIIGDMAYDYEYGSKKGSTLEQFLDDLKERTSLRPSEEDIEYENGYDQYSIWDDEIVVHMRKNGTIEYISYDEDYLEKRYLNNM